MNHVRIPGLDERASCICCGARSMHHLLPDDASVCEVLEDLFGSLIASRLCRSNIATQAKQRFGICKSCCSEAA